MNYDKEFDASGLACPMPIVKTKKSLADMASGQVLGFEATDRGSVCDMEAYAEQPGDKLLAAPRRQREVDTAVRRHHARGVQAPRAGEVRLTRQRPVDRGRDAGLLAEPHRDRPSMRLMTRSHRAAAVRSSRRCG